MLADHQPCSHPDYEKDRFTTQTTSSSQILYVENTNYLTTLHLSNLRPSSSSSANSGRFQPAFDNFTNMGRKNKNKKTSTSPSPSVAGEIQPAKSETKDNSGAASLATKHEEPISSQSGSSTMPPDEPVPDGVARSSRTDTGHDEHSSAPAPAIQTPEHTDIDTSSGTSSDSKNPGSEVSNGGTQSEVAGGEPRARESLATPVHQNDSAAENISGRVRSFFASFSKQSVLN